MCTCMYVHTLIPTHSSANHESDFASFHTSIIKRTAGKGGQKPGCAILLSIKAFHGELGQLRRDFPVTITLHDFGAQAWIPRCHSTWYTQLVHYNCVHETHVHVHVHMCGTLIHVHVHVCSTLIHVHVGRDIWLL